MEFDRTQQSDQDNIFALASNEEMRDETFMNSDKPIVSYPVYLLVSSSIKNFGKQRN